MISVKEKNEKASELWKLIVKNTILSRFFKNCFIQCRKRLHTMTLVASLINTQEPSTNAT